MKTEQLGVVTSIKNETGNLIEQGHFVNAQGVTFNSEEETNTSLGIALADTEADEMVPVAVTGIALAKTGGAILQGDHVYCDTVIYKINYTDPKTTQEIEKRVGVALDAASASGEYIRVLIK